MSEEAPSKLDRTLAALCRACPVCRQARRTQAGLAYTMVKRVESALCPACRAYRKVTGRAAHEPLPQPADGD